MVRAMVGEPGLKPEFSRLRKALLLEGEPDRVPLWEGSIDADIKRAVLGRPLQGWADEVQFWAAAGYDYVPVQLGLRTLLRTGITQVAESAAVTASAAFAPVRHAFKAHYNPFIPDERERVWAEEGKGVITTREEFERFPWPRAADLDYGALDEVAALLPPGMRIVAVVGFVYTTAWWLIGFQSFCQALGDDPELIRLMFERVGAIQRDACAIILRHPAVGALFMPDDIAYSEALIVSPRVLREHIFPWYAEIGRLCRARGLPYVYHSDGTVEEVLPDLIAAGFNALHPIEPKAMDIEHLKRTVGDRLCLLGNIDLGYTLTLGTPDEVKAEVKQRLRVCAPGGGYALGSSNSVTEYVPIANYHAMRRAAFTYGRYPIRL